MKIILNTDMNQEDLRRIKIRKILKKRQNSGPKPRRGDRDESGKLKPGDPRLDNLWQRIRQHAVKLGTDPRMESEVGRLTMFGHLTGSDFEAANRLAKIIGRWEALHGYPQRRTPSPSYLVGRVRYNNNNDGDIDLEESIINETNSDYKSAMKEIPEFPTYIRFTVESVVVDNNLCPQDCYSDLHTVLGRLAKLWNIK